VIKRVDLTYVKKIKAHIRISGSKSESNRALILQKLFPSITVENRSDSDDTLHLINALNTTSEIIDIGHAGTAMRFLTAFFSIQEGRITTLTGSDRMKQRPVKILVDALKELGADIEYLSNEGYPPLKITGKKLSHNKVTLKANVSSQYISALLLIGPAMDNGLELTLDGEITSIPYIKMTLTLLNQIGIKTIFEKNTIRVSKPDSSLLNSYPITIEPDWSSASYFYSLVAMHGNAEIFLKGFKNNSLQGDRVLADIYKSLGVETVFDNEGITLKSTLPIPLKLGSNVNFNSDVLHLNLITSPDITQTIAVTCFGLGIKCHLTGLHTLKIKETDRLTALKNELEKMGAEIEISEDSFTLKGFPKTFDGNYSPVKTYDDHRMAMSFAPLSVKFPIKIENPEVVTKSYKEFWTDWVLLKI
jgi:3-phosphoshikimate 1-carboxyvinyltransferase